VDVRTQSYVVGEVPAIVIRVFVDHDVVAVPEPVVAEAQVERGDAEVEASEPETAGAASGKVPDVASPEASGEVAVLPGMIEMKTGVVSSVLVPDPLPVVVDVWGFGMAFMVAKSRMGSFMRRAVVCGWTVVGNVSAAYVAMLRPGGEGKDHRHCKKSD
jgi:putative intracellular protease/amidase